MNWNRASRSVQPFLFAAALAWPAAGVAQQAPAPKPAPKPQQAAAAPAAAPSPTSQATLLGQFGDWGAYTATPGGRKVCFALAKPTSSVDNPPNRRTATNVVYMFISSRPQDKVKDEVSILVTGYQLKVDGSITIGGATFPMHAQNDNAWAKNVADEARIVDALRKGSDVVVKGTTSRGTQTTDTFSLKGIAQALDRVAQECK
jgi:invasion protein IalB